MGKDAANTILPAENQGLNQQSSALEKNKDAAGFHGDKWQNVKDGEQYKNTSSSTVRPMEDPNAGGFHGDKWKNLPGEELSQGPQLTNSMGDEFPAELGSQAQMGASKKILGKDEIVLRPGSDWAELPPAHTVITTQPPAPIVSADHSSGLQDIGVHNDILKNETREAKKEMHAELKTQAGHSDKLLPSELQYEGTTIHDGRSGGMLPDGRTVAPELAKSMDNHDNTMRDATIHDGRTRTIHDTTIVEQPLEKMSLKDRIIAGVKAGDPLSSATLDTKKTKSDHHSTADQHLKSDNSLIPHEHLKKDESLLADAHLAGDLKKEVSFKKDKKDKKAKDKKAKKEKHFENDTHLNKDTNIVENTHLHKDAQLTKEELILKPHSTQPTNQESVFTAEGLNKDAHLEGSDKKSAKLKDKALKKKDKLKEKLGMKKGEELKSADAIQGQTEASASSTKGHEIATIKIPGIESGDRAAQEMVNHQAKAKKELNAELKEHVGHSDHIAPSEILGLGHGMEQMSIHENRAVDSQTMMPNKGTDAMADQITRDQVLAKSELNAEIKNHAGEQLMPSGLQSNQLQDIQGDKSDKKSAKLKDKALKKKDKLKEKLGMKKGEELKSADAIQGEQFLSKDFQKDQFDNKDSLMKENMSAKKELNAEILEHATMGSDNILPSEIHGKDQLLSKDLKSEDLQSKNQFPLEQNKDFSKDQILAKKDLNAEIQDAAGSNANAIMPSEIAHKHGAEMQSSDKMTGLSESNDLKKENMAAKKELNAEILEHATMGSDNILPSEIHDKDFQSEKHSEKADFHKDQFMNKDSQSKEHFENTDKFQNSQFSTKEYLDDKPGSLGAIFKDGVMHDHVMAVKDLNAEIKEAASMAHDDQLLPSEISSGAAAMAPGGVTVIHDGRSDAQGSDRLKGEMDYEQAHGEAASNTEGLSMRERIMGAVSGAASTVSSAVPSSIMGAVSGAASTVSGAAVAVKDSLQGTLQGRH